MAELILDLKVHPFKLTRGEVLLGCFSNYELPVFTASQQGTNGFAINGEKVPREEIKAAFLKHSQTVIEFERLSRSERGKTRAA